MKKHNRIISIILILTFAASLMLPSMTPLAAESPTIYVNEMFDDQITNDIPDNFNITKGTDGRVVLRDEKNLDKAAFAKTLASAVSMSVEVPELPDKYVVSADIMIDGQRVDGNILSIKGSGTITLLQANVNGEITLNNGYRAGGYRLGTWANYTFVINRIKQKYDFYINGKKIVGDFYLSNNIAAEKSIGFDIKKGAGESSGLYVDNVRVYSGDKIMKDSFFPKAQKNPGDIPYEETENFEIGNKVILNSSGKDGIAPYFVPKIGVAEFAPLPGEEKMRIHFSRPGGTTADIFADITLSGTEDLIHFVYQLDVYPAGFSSNNTLIFLGTTLGLNLFGNGSVELGGQRLMSIPMKKWSTITVVFRTDMGVADAYLNGELVVKDVQTSVAPPATMRIGLASESYKADIYMDNFQFYEGSEPRDLSQQADAGAGGLSFVGDTKDDVAKAAKGGSVFMNDRDVVYYNGEKTSYTALGGDKIYKEGILFADTATVATVLGKEIFYDADSGEIKSELALASIGKATVNVGGKELPLAAAPFVTNDKAYIPVYSYAENALGLHGYEDSRGWLYVSKTDWRFSNNYYSYREPVDIIDGYLQFDRPSGQKIYDDMVANGNYKKHPRLFATDESVAELRANIKTNPTMAKWARNIMSTADGLCNREPVKYEIPDGLRLFLSCLEVRERLYAYATAYLASGNKKYAEGAWKEIENACNWKDWNVDMHYLDSGKIGPGMAVAYDVFYNEFTEEQKAFMRQKVKEHYMDYAIEIYAGRTNSNLVTNTSNWGAVCNGSMLMWCLATMDEEDAESDYTKAAKHLAACTLQSIEAPIVKLYPSGTWNEGPSYFQYVLEYTTWAALSLTNSCGTDYGIFEYPGFMESINYVMYMQTTNGYFNLSETGEAGSKATLDAPEVFLAARLTNDDDLTAAWYNIKFNVIGKGAKTLDLLFYKPVDTTNLSFNYPLDRHFDGLEMEIMRSDWESASGKAVCVTAGDWGSSSHFDMGNFSFDALGVRWAMDLGKVNQAVAGGYLGKDGYTLYRKRAEGHNCIVINPDETPGQKPNEGGYVVKSEYKPRGAYAVYDLTDVYSENLSAYKRGIYFGDDRNTLTVQDEFTLTKGGSDIYWFMHTKADIEISPDKKSAILSESGQQLRVEFDTSFADYTLEVMDAKPLPTTPERPDQKQNKGFRKLVLKAKGSREQYITAKLIPVEPRKNYEAAKYVPISDWSIPDGEIEPLMNITSIQIDGSPIIGFDPLKTEYNYSTIDTSRIPVVSATATRGNITVTQADKMGSYATISLTDGIETLTYKVLIEEGIIDSMAQTDETLKPSDAGTITDALVATPMTVGTPNGMHRLFIKGFYAADAQSGNPGEHIFDQNMTTKWASDMKEVNIVADLGSVRKVDGLALAFTLGDSRNYKFDILVSDDNVNYKRVFTGQSTGKTADYEHIALNVNARYIRFIGYGHATGEWNNLNEFAPYVIE